MTKNLHYSYATRPRSVIRHPLAWRLPMPCFHVEPSVDNDEDDARSISAERAVIR